MPQQTESLSFFKPKQEQLQSPTLSLEKIILSHGLG